MNEWQNQVKASYEAMEDFGFCVKELNFIWWVYQLAIAIKIQCHNRTGGIYFSSPADPWLRGG